MPEKDQAIFVYLIDYWSKIAHDPKNHEHKYLLERLKLWIPRGDCKKPTSPYAGRTHKWLYLNGQLLWEVFDD